MSRFLEFTEARRGMLAVGLLLWAVCLVTPITWFLFFHLATEFNGPVATAYVALIGLPFAPALLQFVKDRLSR